MTCRPYFSAGTNLLAVGRELRLHAEHDRHVGSVDVAVDDADAAAALRERDGEVDGDGRLADAAFAGADRDDVLHAGQRLRARLRRRPPRARIALMLHVDARHAGHRHHGRARLIAHLILDRTRRRGQLDSERDACRR